MKLRSVFVATALLAPATAGAQDPGRTGSRIVPLDSWTYEGIERLRTRGHLVNLNPMVQPYRRIDVAVGLLELSPDSLEEPVAGWVRLLREEFAPELDRLREGDRDDMRVGLRLDLGASAADSRRRDPLVPYRAEGDPEPRVWPLNAEGLWIETHNVAAEARLFADHWHSAANGDPDGRSPGGKLLLGRTRNAYLTLAHPWGDIWIGRLVRNWGPLGRPGMMLSDNPTSYPGLALDIGRGKLSVRFVLGELEAIGGLNRHIVANRLDYGSGNFWISIGEAKLFSSDRQSIFRFLNPAEIFFFDHDAEPADVVGNLMFNGIFWARVAPWTVYGELAIDDFDRNAFLGIEDRDAEPATFQMSIGTRYLGLAPRVELGLDYRRVSSWSYRTVFGEDRWSYLDRGLADPWSDYDRLALRADVYTSVSGLRLTPALQLQRMGEGDYRTVIPATGNLGLPSNFVGVVETTRRLAIMGRYQPVRQFFVEWDVGRSFVSNAGHVEGFDEGRFSYLIRLGLTFEFLGGGI